MVHEGPGSSSGEVLIGSSSCRVHYLGGILFGRESSCLTGLRAEGILGVSYGMFGTICCFLLPKILKLS